MISPALRTVRPVSGAADRKLWLDWQRGLAVVYMVEWHAWDSWRADAVAHGPLHDAVSLIGGLAAPSFLYMAGMGHLLGDAALERKGVPAGERRGRAARRALSLLAIAYLFRAAEFLLGGAFREPGGWRDLLRVDILNVIAVAFLVASLITVGLPPLAQALLAATAAAAVALLTPVVAGWQHAPSRILDYLYSEWPRANFCIFPWAAFCLAGAALGRLALRPPRPIAWLAGAGVLCLGGLAGRLLPAVYAHQDFWHTSPSWFAIRLAGVVATSGLLQLLPAGADRWLSWLRTMGRHSLLGYFLSVELPYGLASGPLHRRLGAGSTLLGVVAMVAVTWSASRLADRYQAWRAERGRPATARPAAP